MIFILSDATINLICVASLLCLFLLYLCYMIVVLQEEKVDSSLEFLILASDGLWDVVSNEVCNDIRFFPSLLFDYCYASSL